MRFKRSALLQSYVPSSWGKPTGNMRVQSALRLIGDLPFFVYRFGDVWANGVSCWTRQPPRSSLECIPIFSATGQYGVIESNKWGRAQATMVSLVHDRLARCTRNPVPDSNRLDISCVRALQGYPAGAADSGVGEGMDYPPGADFL